MTKCPTGPEPRLLTARQAAGYFNLPTPQFEGLGVGRVSFGARVLYDRVALDRYLDQLSGLGATAEPGLVGAEAALARFTADLAGAAGRGRRLRLWRGATRTLGPQGSV
jgi:hypothetical protein